MKINITSARSCHSSAQNQWLPIQSVALIPYTTLILAYSGLNSVPKHDEQTPAPDPCTTESLVPPPEYSRYQLGSLPYFHQISAKSHLSGIRSQITLQEIVPSFPTVLLFCIVSLFTIYICSLALPHLSPK